MKEANALLIKLRELGYAVRAFSPAELDGADPINVEAAMGAAGSSAIEYERFYQPDPMRAEVRRLRVWDQLNWFADRLAWFGVGILIAVLVHAVHWILG